MKLSKNHFAQSLLNDHQEGVQQNSQFNYHYHLILGFINLNLIDYYI